MRFFIIRKNNRCIVKIDDKQEWNIMGTKIAHDIGFFLGSHMKKIKRGQETEDSLVYSAHE